MAVPLQLAVDEKYQTAAGPVVPLYPDYQTSAVTFCRQPAEHKMSQFIGINGKQVYLDK